MGEISEPIFRPIICAQNARFRFSTSYPVSKQQRHKGDRDQKSTLNFGLSDPVKITRQNARVIFCVRPRTQPLTQVT